MKKGGKGATAKRTSRLADGGELPKGDPRFEAIGTLDELAAHLSLIGFDLEAPETATVATIIEDLTALSAALAADKASAGITEEILARLQSFHDNLFDTVDPGTAFVRARFNRTAARADIARTICRRAERDLLRLAPGSVDDAALLYVDLLSDWIFLLARKLDAG